MPVAKTAPKKVSRRVDDDDDDEKVVAKKKPRRSEDEDDDEPTKKSSGIKRGWGEVAKKRASIDEASHANDGMPRDFFLTDGENANIQFLDDEPTIVEGHNVKIGSDKYHKFTPCQKMTQRNCLMCSEGVKKSTKYYFKVADYRGTWDKDKKKFKFDKPVVKLWAMGLKAAEQVKAYADKKHKELSELVLSVTRSGGGISTSYNFEQAFDADDDEIKLKPIKIKDEFDDTTELIKPMSTNRLEELGFSVDDDN